MDSSARLLLSGLTLCLCIFCSCYCRCVLSGLLLYSASLYLLLLLSSVATAAVCAYTRFHCCRCCPSPAATATWQEIVESLYTRFLRMVSCGGRPTWAYTVRCHTCLMTYVRLTLLINYGLDAAMDHIAQV